MDDGLLTEYMADATNRLIGNIVRNTKNEPRETLFLMRFASHAKKSSAIRSSYESRGFHIPGFLISSITSECNLHCKGCYARANGICGDVKADEMADEKWMSIFDQARALGISFCILAGGEPLMRRNLVENAANMKEMVFPIFTNGTIVDDGYMNLFRKNRNLVPVVSIEGGKSTTDERRGEGVYEKIVASMKTMTELGIFHGASVTVTTENYREVTSQQFADMLRDLGCGIVFYIEYVPSKCDRCKAFDDRTRPLLDTRVDDLRSTNTNMVFLSFPGDERNFGGCIGAGRGFFHINPFGDAEACPASPYHDRSLKDNTLAEVLGSPLFAKIREEGMMEGSHTGGCILSEKDNIIRTIVDTQC